MLITPGGSQTSAVTISECLASAADDYLPRLPRAPARGREP
jgi:hypothetical protein